MPRPLGSKNKKPRKTPERSPKKSPERSPKKSPERSSKKSSEKTVRKSLAEKTPKKSSSGEKLRTLLQCGKQSAEKKFSRSNSESNDAPSRSKIPTPEKKKSAVKKRKTVEDKSPVDEKKPLEVEPKIRKKRKKKADSDNSKEDCFSSGGEDSAVNSPANTPVKQEYSIFYESFTGREPRTCVQLMRQKQIRSPLIKTLDYLQRQLEEKDPQQYFAWPVTDQIAPGYSKMIKIPMDFSTMRQKIEDDSYTSLTEFAGDFKRMCDNAMTYNRSDSVYFKTAKKLLRGGMKLLSQEKVEKLAPYLKFIYDVPKEQLGFEIKSARPFYENQAVSPRKRDSTDAVETPARKNSRLLSSDSGAESKAERSAMEDSETEPEPTPKKPKKLRIEEPLDDELPVQPSIVVDKPKAKLISKRQNEEDGTTTLAIVVPKDGYNSIHEKIVTIGQMVGKLAYGTASLYGLGGDRRRVRAVRPLYYGAFTSYAPTYDSTFATISKDDTDMIYELYSDENSFLYTEKTNSRSIEWAKKCDYALDGVDNLLDLISGGEYKRALNAAREPTPEDDVIVVSELTSDKNLKGNFAPVDVEKISIEIEQLKSLADLGIDVSFLNELELQDKKPPNPDPIQDRLEHATALIDRLQKIQNDRLSHPTPGNLNFVLQPSDMEVHVAQMLTESLADLVKRVSPKAVVTVPAVRKAMGIETNSKDASTEIENGEILCSEDDELQLIDDDDEEHQADDNEPHTDNEIHMDDNELHTDDNELHIDDNELHTDDNEIHMDDNELHTDDNELHTDENEHQTDDNDVEMLETSNQSKLESTEVPMEPDVAPPSEDEAINEESLSNPD